MKTVIAYTLCLLVLCAGVVCAANGPGVGVGFTPYSNTQVSIHVNLTDVARTGYDYYDSSFSEAWDDPGSTDYVYATFRRDAGVDGWDGPSGWGNRLAYPVPPRGSSIIDTFYVLAGPSFAYDTFRIGYMDAGFPHPEEWIRTLRLVKVADGITYTGPREWNIPLYTTKVNGAFLPDAVLPAYRSENPYTGYEFEIEIQHVSPEPSSLLALAGGIAGLGGFALRRRRG